MYYIIIVISLFSYYNSTVFAFEEKELVIIYSGNAVGEIKPCGCSKEGDKGGFMRRATFIKEMRRQYKDIILLDVGDNFGEPSEQGRLRAEFMIRAFGILNYNALGVGERDLLYGYALLQKDLPWLFSIRSFKEEGYKRLKVGDIEINLIGLSDPELFYSSGHEDISIPEPISYLKEKISQIRGDNSNITIILSHLKWEKVVSLLDIDGVDIIINGHVDANHTKDDIRPANIIRKGDKNKIASHPGNRGQYIGVMKVKIRDNAVYAIEDNWFPLLPTYKDDAEINALYADYDSKVQEIFLRTLKDKKPLRSMYAGSIRCKECHKIEYEVWEKSKHSKAYEALKEVNKHYDPECILCHTTGFNKGGFLSEDMTKELANVQCEMCHGEGLTHINSIEKDTAYANNNAKGSCINCHTKINDPNFEFEQYWQKILH